MKIHWKCKRFEDIPGDEMHAILALRQQVFIVEQKCVYQDADALDTCSWHLLGRGMDGGIAAYGRVNVPGSRYRQPSFGRILTRRDVRGLGVGREVVRRCLEICQNHYPDLGVRISAQTYLIKFYRDFGFRKIGEPYDDEGVEHIDMVLGL
jgi:ElaA protein